MTALSDTAGLQSDHADGTSSGKVSRRADSIYSSMGEMKVGARRQSRACCVLGIVEGSDTARWKSGPILLRR